MMKRSAIAAARPLLAAAAGLLLQCSLPGTYTLTGEIFDRSSGMPVYAARVRFDDRSTMLFTTRQFTLRSLSKGTGTLTVSAPGYATQSRRIRLSRRETRVAIGLEGKEVPGLAGVLVWGEKEGDSLRLDIRLLDTQGSVIERFPLLPFRARVKIWENLGSESAPLRGWLLYQGDLEPSFDPASRLDKLRCRIGMRELKTPRAGVQLGVLDVVLHTGQGDFPWTRGDLQVGQGGGR